MSHSRTRAYIRIVVEMQEASAAGKSSCGAGPASPPPRRCGSSVTRTCRPLSIETSCRSDPRIDRALSAAPSRLNLSSCLQRRRWRAVRQRGGRRSQATAIPHGFSRSTALPHERCALFPMAASPPRATMQRMAHRILILGGGTGGTIMANRLRRAYAPTRPRSRSSIATMRTSTAGALLSDGMPAHASSRSPYSCVLLVVLVFALDAFSGPQMTVAVSARSHGRGALRSDPRPPDAASRHEGSVHAVHMPMAHCASSGEPPA